MERDFLIFNRCYITSRINLIILHISLNCKFVNLRSQNTLSSQVCHCLVKATNSSEKVYKLKTFVI